VLWLEPFEIIDLIPLILYRLLRGSHLLRRLISVLGMIWLWWLT
jgi:hypothetical protein